MLKNQLITLVILVLTFTSYSQTALYNNPEISSLEIRVEKIKKENAILEKFQIGYLNLVDSLNYLLKEQNDTSNVGYNLYKEYLNIELNKVKLSVEESRKSLMKLVLLIDTLNTKHQTYQDESKDLREDCIRGQAEPIVLKSVFPNTHFRLNADSLSGIETVDFENGDKLIINNWGCEYYTLTFRFETLRFQGDIVDIPFWYKKAVILVGELVDGIDSPIDIKKGIDKLTNYIEANSKNNYANLKFGEEIDFGIEGTRIFVSLDQIEKLSKDKFAITISFSVGPL